jgi:hypothetical protein
MILTTCPNHDEATAQAPAKASARGPVRPVGEPGRAAAALSACQCHRCAPPTPRRDGAGDDLDAYIADLAERAPPLTSEQLDKLALLLHDHRRSRVTGIHTRAA